MARTGVKQGGAHSWLEGLGGLWVCETWAASQIFTSGFKRTEDGLNLDNWKPAEGAKPEGNTVHNGVWWGQATWRVSDGASVKGFEGDKASDGGAGPKRRPHSGGSVEVEGFGAN